MKKNKQAQTDQGESSQTTLFILSQWIGQSKMAVVLIPAIVVAIAVFIIAFASRQFENSWYSIYFISAENKLSRLAIFIIIIDALRWLCMIVIWAFIALIMVLPTDSKIFETIFKTVLKVVAIMVPIMSFLIGLQNLVLYNTVGWENLNITQVGEGIYVFLFCAAFILIFFGAKIQIAKKSIFIESLFNLDLMLFPLTAVLTSSVGGFKILPQWFTIISVLACLLILIIGIDELKGKPTIYTHLVTIYSTLEVGHISLQTLRKRSAADLANALASYNRLTSEQQEALGNWILDNNKPSFINRFWAITKIVVSTVLLTTLVQEPAIILFKWFLKKIFGYTY